MELGEQGEEEVDAQGDVEGEGGRGGSVEEEGGRSQVDNVRKDGS